MPARAPASPAPGAHNRPEYLMRSTVSQCESWKAFRSSLFSCGTPHAHSWLQTCRAEPPHHMMFLAITNPFPRPAPCSERAAVRYRGYQLRSWHPPDSRRRLRRLQSGPVDCCRPNGMFLSLQPSEPEEPRNGHYWPQTHVALMIAICSRYSGSPPRRRPVATSSRSCGRSNGV